MSLSRERPTRCATLEDGGMNIDNDDKRDAESGR